MSTSITDGARALRAYLDRVGLSVPTFCEQHGLDRITVQRVLRGERRRISVDFAHAIEEATGGQVAWSLWRSATAAAASSHTPEPSRKAKRRRGGSGSSGGNPGTSARPSRVSKRVRPGGSGAASATEAELLAEMAPEALADAGDRCRVCGCCDVAACPGGCSWVTRELCSSCADLLEQLVSRVSTSGRREAELVEEIAEAFNEQLQDQAEAYVRKALDDLLGRGVLRREGGRLWRSPPATSRRARPASRRASAEAAP